MSTPLTAHDDTPPGRGIRLAFAGVARYPARIKCALLGWMAFKDAAARAVAVEESR